LPDDAVDEGSESWPLLVKRQRLLDCSKQKAGLGLPSLLKDDQEFVSGSLAIVTTWYVC
jgi:hypothetical protein